MKKERETIKWVMGKYRKDKRKVSHSIEPGKYYKYLSQNATGWRK